MERTKTTPALQNVVPEIEIPEHCPTAKRHFGPHYFRKIFTTEDGATPFLKDWKNR